MGDQRMATNARQDYPLSAIVGQDDMKLALCLISAVFMFSIMKRLEKVC